MTIGETNPPRLPIMFIAPDTVPVNLPPMSMQAVHAPGIVRSLKKLAIAIAATA